MSLQSWLQIGHLINHQASVAEVRNLLGVVDRELADASVLGLSDDGRFTHAYMLRHTSLYSHAGVVQKQDADDLQEAARQLRTDVLNWLRSQHPGLLPSGY